MIRSGTGTFPLAVAVQGREHWLQSGSAETRAGRILIRRSIYARNGLVHSFVQLAAGTVGAQVLNIPLLILVARALGPREFGVQSVALAVSTLAILVLDAGSSVSFQRQIAAHGVDEMADNWLRRRLGLCGWLAAFAVVGFAFRMPLIGTSVLFVALSVSNNARLSAFRGVGKYRAVSFVLILDRVGAFLFLIPVLLGFTLQRSFVLTGSYAAGAVVQFIVLLTMSRVREGVPTIPSFRIRSFDFRVGSRFLGLSLLNESQRLDVPIVALAAGPVQAGLFGSTSRVTGPLGMPVFVLSQVLLRDLVKASQQGKRRIVVWCVAGVGLFYSLLGSAMLFVARPAITATIGVDFLGAADALRILTFGLIPASINQVMSTALTATHNEKVTFARVAFTAPASLVLVYVGSTLAGATGASVGFLAAQTVLVLLLVGPTMRSLGVRSTSSRRR